MVFSNIDYVFLLKKDIYISTIGYTLSIAISQAMCKDKQLLELHTAKEAKPYSFSNPQPNAKNGIYEKDSIYRIQIKSCSEVFADKIMKLLEGFENDYVKSIMIQSKKFTEYIPVKELICLNPIIITLPKSEDGKFNANKYANVRDRVIINLLKKYNHFTGEDVVFDDVKNMFTVEEILGRPIPVKIKGCIYIGVRFKYTVADNPLAQRLAYFAQYCGLGEKNTICGAGFCLAIPKTGGVVEC